MTVSTDVVSPTAADPEVVSLVDKAVGALAGLSAQVEEIEFTLDDPISIMQPLWSVALALGVASMTMRWSIHHCSISPSPVFA